MANLQGKKISNTYEGLIKTENNSAVSGSTILTDGAGNSLQITVNTDGTLTAQTITAGNLNVSNWDEAYSWGDHSLSGYATSSDVANAVNDVINAAPTALDTLDELAAALGDDANFATTITNLITGVSDRVTVLENAGFITTDTNTQLSDADIAALGYVKTDTQLTDAEIAALGYIKTDTNTQRTDAEIDARIALNPEGFITSYVDTNTQLTDAEIAAMGYIKTDTNTQLSDSDIAAMGYIKTDTNTQRTDAEIDARIALNPEGFLTSETDSQTLTFTTATGDLTISNGNTVNIPDNNTQLSDADIAAFGYIKTDTNTQRTDSEINALIDANTNNFISDYTVTESDVTAHEGAITITESQISDLSHFSGSYNDLTDKPAGIVARSDEEIEDVIGAAISGSGATSVVYNDAAGTIVVSSTDTNTQLTDAEIAAFGYIKTDTNTQLSDADITALGYIKVDTNTQLTDGEIAAFGYVKTDTNTQLSDSDIAAFGYIKTDTNTQRSDAEIQAIIDANSAGFITTYVDTNTQLSDADIAAMGYIKTDTNTQLSDSDIAALGYIKTDTNTQRTDAEINALITTGISGLATETYVDNAVSNLVDSAPNTLDTLNELADALGDDPNFATTVSTNIGNVSSRVTTLENANYISDYTVTQGDVTAHEGALTITESQISDLSHFSGSYNDLTDKPSGVNPRTDEEIEDVVGSLVSGTGATTVTYNDAAGTLVINSTDTNTQRTNAEIDARIALNPEGFVTTDTNTQLSDSDIAAFGYIKTDTNTQLSDSDIAAFGYIKTDTNTQRTNAEIDARIALNPEGFVTTDTNTQLSDSDISAFGYIKTDTNTQLTDAQIAAMGYIKTDTNTQLSDSDIAALGYIKTDTNTQRTNAEIDARIALNPEGFVSTDTNTQLSDSDIAAFGYIKTDTNTQRTDTEIIDVIDGEGFVTTSGNIIIGTDSDINTSGATVVDQLNMTDGVITSHSTRTMTASDLSALPTSGGTLTGGLEVNATSELLKLNDSSSTGSPFVSFNQNSVRRSFIQHNDTNDTLILASEYGNIDFKTASNGSESSRMLIDSTGNVGISETSPDTFLHVTKNALSKSWTANSNTIATFENSADAYVNIASGGSNKGELWFSDDAHQGRGRLRYDHTGDTMEIWAANGPKAYFYSTGNVTITGNLSENSDISLKENVSTIENALDKVNSLRGIEYNMIADEDKTKKIGFIAQEVEEVVPELVFDNGDIKSVAYSNTVALLVESVKELTDKVNDLQGQIDAMRA